MVDKKHESEQPANQQRPEAYLAGIWKKYFSNDPGVCCDSNDVDDSAGACARCGGRAGRFNWFAALAPAVWLVIVGACLLIALGAVGYLSIDPELKGAEGTTPGSPFARFEGVFPEPVDFAKRRAAWAFSGVTLAVTLALAITSAFWAGKAFLEAERNYRRKVLAWNALFVLLSLGVLGGMFLLGVPPFASMVGEALLKQAYSDAIVPTCMFALACLLPAILATGACLLLEPIPNTDGRATARQGLETLHGRLRALDQLLYVGALTLVFGTLQLSSGLTSPLAGMPSLPDLQIKADLCKLVSPAPPASSPFADPDETIEKGSYYEGFNIDECRKLPKEFARVAAADDLRQVARGITLSFGLAFSALLAAIYVPALIGMGMMIEPLQKQVSWPASDGAAKTDGAKEEKVDVGDVDPLRRVAAAIATLSPLIASLLANAFGTG